MPSFSLSKSSNNLDHADADADADDDGAVREGNRKKKSQAFGHCPN